jgi:formamidopyrimidine-DNA glycosylase
MPELPDITIYVEALSQRIVGKPLEAIRLKNPFLLRTFSPPIAVLEGRSVREVIRIGKRIAWGFHDELWLVFHLMIAGRLSWQPSEAKLSGKHHLAAFDFGQDSVILTEAGSKRRASLHVVRGKEALRQLDPGGIDVLAATPEQFQGALRCENHTLKRALTDPRLFSGIGNSYSDEILHRARLSPLALTQKLTQQEIHQLYQATQHVLTEWIIRLRAKCGDGFPKNVTAFRPEMAVHGKFGQFCPICQAPIQRIRYAEKETNYCPGCQTEGRLLADRSLSRLLKDDRPKHLDDL